MCLALVTDLTALCVCPGQENLRTRQPEPGAAAAAGRGRGRGASSAAARAGTDTFAVRSVTGAPMKLKLSRSHQQQQELRRRQQQEGGEPEEYAVLPSEIPALRPGQRDPIYHQTQYRVYQPPDPTPLPPARSVVRPERWTGRAGP